MSRMLLTHVKMEHNDWSDLEPEVELPKKRKLSRLSQRNDNNIDGEVVTMSSDFGTSKIRTNHTENTSLSNDALMSQDALNDLVSGFYNSDATIIDDDGKHEEEGQEEGEPDGEDITTSPKPKKKKRKKDHDHARKKKKRKEKKKPKGRVIEVDFSEDGDDEERPDDKAARITKWVREAQEIFADVQRTAKEYVNFNEPVRIDLVADNKHLKKLLKGAVDTTPEEDEKNFDEYFLDLLPYIEKKVLPLQSKTPEACNMANAEYAMVDALNKYIGQVNVGREVLYAVKTKDPATKQFRLVTYTVHSMRELLNRETFGVFTLDWQSLEKVVYSISHGGDEETRHLFSSAPTFAGSDVPKLPPVVTKKRNIFDLWKGHRRSAFYSELVFNPFPVGSLKGPPVTALNKYQGLQVEREEVADYINWDCIVDYLSFMRWTFCDTDAEFNCMLGYFAWIIQNPGEKAEVAYCIGGGQGNGKTSLFDNIIGHVFGPNNYGVCSNIDSIVGNFNEGGVDKLFLVMDEAYFAGSIKEKNRLNSVITGVREFQNRKNIPGSYVFNYKNLAFLSNQWQHFMNVDKDSRRFVIVFADAVPYMTGLAEMGTKFNCVVDMVSFFNAALYDNEREGLLTLANFFYNLPLLDWYNIKEIPVTRLLSINRLASMPVLGKWYFQMLRDGGQLMVPDPDSTYQLMHSEWYPEVELKFLYAEYQQAEKAAKTKYVEISDPTAFWTSLQPLLPRGATQYKKAHVVPGTGKRSHIMMVKFPPLEECQKYFSEEYCKMKIDWSSGSNEETERFPVITIPNPVPRPRDANQPNEDGSPGVRNPWSEFITKPDETRLLYGALPKKLGSTSVQYLIATNNYVIYNETQWKRLHAPENLAQKETKFGLSATDKEKYNSIFTNRKKATRDALRKQHEENIKAMQQAEQLKAKNAKRVEDFNDC